jgi:hypothetical protein
VSNLRRIPWWTIATVVVLVGLAARLAWVASHTETGWETIAADWHAAAIGQFFGYRLPVAQRGQKGQNDFWLPEVDRVLSREPRTPELIVGAIQFLDVYNGDYQQILASELMSIPYLDGYEGPNWVAEPGPDRRHAKQLSLTTAACAEFPSSTLVWQTRAEECAPYARTENALADDNNWQTVLDECRRHDPGNSLYDFLAAHRLLNDARNLANEDEFGVGGNPLPDDVLNQHRAKEIELDDEATKLVQRALDLPRFEAPWNQAAVLAFIDKTSLPLREKAHAGAWSNNSHCWLWGVADLLNGVVGRDEARNLPAKAEAARHLAIAVCELDAKQPRHDPLEHFEEARFQTEQWKSWAAYLGRDLTAPPTDEARQAKKTAIE